jgi:hypothetical protein
MGASEIAKAMGIGRASVYRVEPCAQMSLRGGRLRPAAGLVPAKISFPGWRVVLLKWGLCMTLTLRDARRDPIANRALGELSRRYNVVEESSGLVLTQRRGI